MMANVEIPTHYTIRDFQFSGDFTFPKGSLVCKGTSGFTFVNENGYVLGAYTGRPTQYGDVCAGYDWDSNAPTGLLRAIPGVMVHLKDANHWHQEAHRCEKEAFDVISKFVEKRKKAARR